MDLCCVQLSSSFPQTTPPTATFPLRRSRLSAPFHPFLYPNPYSVSRTPRLSGIPRHFPCGGVTRCSSATLENADPEVNDTVFVAGATGKVGSRTVRELLKMGFQVRAGVRSAQRAQTLIQSVREMNLDTDDSNGVKPTEKLEIVECDLEQRDQILPAIGCSSVVICCIGASEKEIFDVTGPYRIDYQATKNLINAARVAKVDHFILLTSLGTNKIGFPAAILNLFWGVLIWKRKAEEELIASGLPYTIVRPGGMERPTDSYKETHNITLSQEDTLFGGQVSNLQVAELMAVMAQNTDLSYCKIVEVVAETTAPLIPMEDLLAKIPSKREGRPKTKKLDVAPKLLDPEPAKSSINEAEADEPAAEAIQGENVVAKPYFLSPYTAYDDLKPPSSPTPTAPNGQRKEIATPDTMSQTPDSTTSGPGTEALPDTTDSDTVKLQKPQPLSPYTAYEDLKPPSSPIPTAPNSQRKEIASTDTISQTPDSPTSVPGTEVVTDTTDSEAVKLQKPQPLSPYTAYEDLKPPSSPSPSAPSNTLDKSVSAPKVVDGVPKVINETLPRNDPRDFTFYHSPFPAYEDLRPPTSPTPSAPNSIANIVSLAESAAETTSMPTDNGVEPSISPADGIELVTAQSTSMDEQTPPEPKPRPLSPYTMYDDMKPPSSPMPSPKVH